MAPYSYSACTRTYEPLWQQWLRRCVRLYLALDEPGSETQAVELALRLLENRLRWYLQVGKPVTPETSAEAWGLLETAQVAWLGDEIRCAQLRRELSVAQVLRPTSSLTLPTLGQAVPYPVARSAWRGRGQPAETGLWGR